MSLEFFLLKFQIQYAQCFKYICQTAKIHWQLQFFQVWHSWSFLCCPENRPLGPLAHKFSQSIFLFWESKHFNMEHKYFLIHICIFTQQREIPLMFHVPFFSKLTALIVKLKFILTELGYI